MALAEGSLMPRPAVLATYSEGDAFDHSAAVGFINIWGLPVRTWTSTWPRQDEAEIPIEA